MTKKKGKKPTPKPKKEPPGDEEYLEWMRFLKEMDGE